MIFAYDRAGLPIDVDEWARLHAIEDYLRVAGTDVGPYWVSTVWLGLDHGFSFGGGSVRPLIFETMVFARDEGSLAGDMDCRRYATEAEALAGHEETCTLIRATTADDMSGGEP